MTALEFSKKYKTLLNNYGVNTPLRLSHYISQSQHESGLKPIKENLNYSAERLLQIFPKYFKTLEEAKKYERKPQAIANKVYANRMGNSDEKSGDGFKYSGKGILQVTGKSNYKRLTEETGIDFINKPELLLDEANSVIASLQYWKWINGNKLADQDDVIAITKAINGGLNGIEHRKKLLEENKKVFGV